MYPDRTQRKLALLAGGELGGWSRRRLEARLDREPALETELEGLREVRRAYRGLAGTASPIDEAARALLRARVRARVREEAARAVPARFVWRPALAAGALASCILVAALAVLMGGRGPADTSGEAPERLAAAPRLELVELEEVRVVVAEGATGPVLRWTNGGADARFVVLRSTRPGTERPLAVVRGHEWTDPTAPVRGLLAYRVVRLPERS